MLSRRNILQFQGLRRAFSSLPVNLENLTEHAAVRQHIVSQRDESKINAPTTLPGDVDTTRQEGVSTARHYMNMGKSLVKLYKSGIVNVWRNNWKVRSLQQQYNFKNVNALTRHILDTSFAQSIEKDKEPVTPTPAHITRSDYQMILRTNMDFKKLPLFAVIFAVFFEMTPLLVMVFPRITPTTCSLPYQISKDHENANRNIDLLKLLRDETTNNSTVHQLGHVELQTLAKVLFHSQMLPVSLYPRKMLEQKVQNHIDRVRADNILLSRFGSVWALDKKELVSACLARAIPTKDRTETQMRADLLLWISNLHEGNFDAGFFFFPIQTSQKQAEKILDL
ncbi:hypothetical protein TRICI_006367 [Trichomonascus ciferrii]|uniref:Letm1 RBD domain-containing protein n=1 Tax=Trichomonascus ciferrii TaxID=44093 RepID=A0A642UHL1_9ASCO|nr:hypothetical protein TRICI_006367 [Trichomonascus ciferrii]